MNNPEDSSAQSPTARRELCTQLKYVLVTPARNEAAFIEKTIQSVIAQTVPPRKWVIVSDGSTDGTDEIVRGYENGYEFIELIRAEHGDHASFTSKVKAFNAGYEKLTGVQHDFIGNLDADVSFEPDYFETLLTEFYREPGLGLAGGLIWELVNGKYVAQKISRNSVAGAVQLFRRKCYVDIGGYIPMDRGGIDAAAEIMARMRGWTVRNIQTCRVIHHRRVVTGKGSVLAARYNKGVMNYLLGYHPLFQMAVCVRRALDKPCFAGSLCTLSGYLWALLRKYQRPVPSDFINFLRDEQMRRLWLGKLRRN